MRALARSTLVLLALLAVAGCGRAPAEPAGSATRGASGAGAPGATDPAGPASEAVSLGPAEALLVEWYANSGTVTPIGAGGAFAAAPRELIQAATGAVSPDGRLAAVSDSSGLAVYRLEDWSLVLRSRESHRLALPIWTADSARGYLVDDARLIEFVISTGQVRDVASLANPVSAAVIAPDGSTLYALSYEGDPYGIDARDVHLAAIETATGAARGRADLDALVLGQRKERAAAGEYWAGYWPALALAPDGRRAYIAHADSDRVTVVDTERMTVLESVTLAQARSPWRRLLGRARDLFVSRAQAKGGPYLRRQAVVSADGRWLLVTGSVARVCGALACEDDEPAGLWVLDARSMAVVHREEGINRVVLSPDGALIAGTGTSVSSEKQRVIGRGVKVLEAGSWRLAGHLEPGVPVTSAVFSKTGRELYLLEPGPGHEYALSNGGQCLRRACQLLHTYGSEGLALVQTRELQSWIGFLLPVPGGR